MPLSKKKREKMAKAARVEHINHLSLNGRGNFLDAQQNADAARYIESGEVRYLTYLPDYSDRRVKA